ncbi:hypothetical protein Tco_0198829 [Tanacetum coccineum]
MAGQSVLKLKPAPKYEVGKSSEQLAELFTKVWADVSKNGRAFNADVLYHRILDTSQLPPLRKQPRIYSFVELTYQSADPISGTIQVCL